MIEPKEATIRRQIIVFLRSKGGAASFPAIHDHLCGQSMCKFISVRGVASVLKRMADDGIIVPIPAAPKLKNYQIAP